VKRFIFICLFSLLLAGCTSLESIPYTPLTTPEAWLNSQPYLRFQVASQSIVLVQPSTSLIVYGLGLLTIGVGWYFWRLRQGQRSRALWGAALWLWGIGALLAGTSYEAFSYTIKCVGREACLWTSGWEILYLLFSAASLDVMLAAVAYACASGVWRKRLIAYAVINFGLYALLVAVGTWLPVKFLISFELLILAAAPNLVIFLCVNGWRYRRTKQRLDFVFLVVWVWLILTIGAYFLCFSSGLPQMLWARGIWFSENDVLHLGLIGWMMYMARFLILPLKDLTSAK
jgi:hypothetical protein